MEFKYRRLYLNADEIAQINQFITDNPQWSRRQLSNRLCEAFNWRQSNGHVRDMVCRSLLLALDRASLIQLPPVRCKPNNPLANRKSPPE